SQRDNTVPAPDLMIRLAEEAENSGLDSIWVGDSLVSKPRFEPITALSYLAARTSSV
ncbi:MAG TPA: LLM class flavin-dependent oxidoreductase, partial [Dehalococcoidia bacterium]|nr:LLM class flavin-dependent oxidoreductase [Dehalococcoidia bacterium]